MKTQSTPIDGLANRRAYTIAQAAELLGVHKVSIYRRLYSGDIKVLKGFGQLMVPATELDRFLNDVTEHQPGRQRGYETRQAKKKATLSE